MPQISIIVPAINEAANLPALAQRIDAALRGRDYEIIIVDDNSPDDTPQVCAQLAEKFPLRLLVRTQPTNGLSGAVLHGFAQARGEILVVMDADLQHPPEKLPELLAPIENGEADFVLGSRYIPGGTTAEKWSAFRKLNSRIATILARPFSGRTNDPMSGFFALKRELYDRAERLTPLGYKIGLELMCKSRAQRIREIPIHFAERTRGQSKLTLKQQFKYLEHLSRLYDYTFPRASPIVKFLIATALSWLVALIIFVALLEIGVSPALAPPLAYPAAILVTAIFHLRYVRTQREFLKTPRPWGDFAIISLSEWAACAIAATWTAYRVTSASAAEIFIIPFAIATIVRYVLRKEFLQDVRGLRRYSRRSDSPSPGTPGEG